MILHCQHCARVTPHRGKAAEIAARVAAVSDPPAHWAMSWRCVHCGKMNRQAPEPAQGQLFGGTP